MLLAASLAACSLQQLAVRSVGDALASSGSVFESDGDPELIGEALPFSLKLIDSLLAEQPDHRGLLLAGARGYLLYSYAYVAGPAETLRLTDFERARALRARARDLYLRANGYASRALALDYPGILEELGVDPEAAVAAVGGRPERDIELLYYTAASLGLAISSSRNEPALLARLPEVEAMLGRALELDESWNEGALHEFAINLEGAGLGSPDFAAIASHYARALDLSGGMRAGLFVTYAEAATIPTQDRDRFVELLERALAVDPDARPDERLLNVIAQQRARWLLENIDEFFL